MHASSLSAGVMAGLGYSSLHKEPEPWGMALGTKNTLQEARSNLPYEPTTTMGVFYASQQAYRISIAPEGTDININYFFDYNCNDF